VNDGLSLPKEGEMLEDKGLCAMGNNSDLYVNALPQASSIPLWPPRTDHAIVRQ
jgi:hypothetical protein